MLFQQKQRKICLAHFTSLLDKIHKGGGGESNDLQIFQQWLPSLVPLPPRGRAFFVVKHGLLAALLAAQDGPREAAVPKFPKFGRLGQVGKGRPYPVRNLCV